MVGKDLTHHIVVAFDADHFALDRLNALPFFLSTLRDYSIDCVVYPDMGQRRLA
jgi:hypothetical protein